MVSVTTLPFSRPLTRADLEKMPDDGHRYELIDGALIVTPAPATQHQSVVLELAVLLREHCADNLKVLIAPFDVALSEDTVIQPDVLVARRGDLTERDLPARPELAVEVLSPSTRRIDPSVLTPPPAAETLAARGGRMPGVLGYRSRRSIPLRVGATQRHLRAGCDDQRRRDLQRA
jgi:hypothetical protein